MTRPENPTKLRAQEVAHVIAPCSSSTTGAS
jgi:hypothetical protein